MQSVWVPREGVRSRHQGVCKKEGVQWHYDVQDLCGVLFIRLCLNLCPTRLPQTSTKKSLEMSWEYGVGIMFKKSVRECGVCLCVFAEWQR
jgi:hypothetical protein